MSDIYLSITETPAVVTLSQPVISGALSSTVTVANTVTVALDANSLSALEQVTVTVGAAVSVSNFPATQVVSVSNLPATQPVSLASLPGSTVTVANFPATQTIVGTVTVGALPSVNIGTAPVFSTMLVDDEANGLGFGQYPVLASLSSSNLAAVTIGVRGTVTANTGLSQPLTDAQLRAAAVTVALDSASLNALENVTVTVGAAVTIAGFSTSSLPPSTVTVGNSVTIGNFPSTQIIAGTVTANISGTVPVSGTFWQATQPVSLASLPASTVTVSSLPAISGTVTANGGNFASETTNAPSHSIQLGWNETLYGYGFRAVNNDGDELPVRNSGAVEVGSLPAISGTVTASSVQGTSVTTSNFTSTTASTTLASANASRRGLTVFNEGAGNLHICAGATATTIAYQVRLSAGDYWECPAIQTSLTHSAQFASSGTARVVEIL